jgi:1A family penicillin-binding protein
MAWFSRLGRVADASSRLLRRHPAFARTLVAIVLLVSWTSAGGAVWFTWDVIGSTPGRDALRHVGDMAQATTLMDLHGRPAFTIFKEQRIEIPLANVSPLVRKAILSIEDQRFYEHRGVDTVRIVGSALANLRQGRRAQGASTLTQQLARQSFLTLDKTYRRKFQEVVVAAELEAEYSKDQILELYLNKVYFGDGLHGIEAASLGFFGKHAADLTLAEAALLAGLVKSPSSYAPTVNLDRAVARRAVVLQAMVDSGAASAMQAAVAKAEPVVLKDALQRDDPNGAWFKEEVRRELVARFGLERVYQGGLKVFTTIDPPLQQAAEQLMGKALAEIEERRSPKGRKAADGEPPHAPLQGALVAIDAANGEVRALVGGRSFEESRFNRAVQARRQPGSAFKPFVFATALENGWMPSSIIDRLDEPIPTLEGDWIPEDEHADAPEMTLRTALRTSSNRAAVRLLQVVGIDKTVDYAKRLGVGSVPSVPSLALGSGEVTLEGLTAAYCTFAAQGVYRAPTLIRRVEDRDGTVIFEADTTATRVVSERTAFLLTSMLSDVVNYGTAWKARREGFLLPAAGKTGTTNDYVDAWFVGYTPKLVTGVWVGFDQPETIVSRGYASDVAVPLWGRFMKVATRDDKPEWFTPPKGLIGVQVCRVSGKLPNAGCSHVEVINDAGEVTERSMIVTDYFPRGQVPIDLCPLHTGESMFGRIAGFFGPQHSGSPESASALGLPEAPGTTPVVPAVSGEPPQPVADRDEPVKKKRGFWSRLFGRRDKADDPKKDSPKPR